MKTIIKTSLLILFISFSFSSFAQFEVLQDVGSGAPLRANPYPDVKGVPFIEDFSPGTIIYSVKDTLRNLPIRFNSYGNMLELQKDGGIFGFSTKEILGFISTLDGKPSLFISGIDIPKVGKDVFVQILVEGEFTIVNHRYKILSEDPSAAYGSQKAKSFQNKNDLYIVTKNGVRPYKSNKKQIQEIFGEKTEKIYEIESSLGFSLKEERDLVRIVSILNDSILSFENK